MGIVARIGLSLKASLCRKKMDEGDEHIWACSACAKDSAASVSDHSDSEHADSSDSYSEESEEAEDHNSALKHADLVSEDEEKPAGETMSETHNDSGNEDDSDISDNDDMFSLRKASNSHVIK